MQGSLAVLCNRNGIEAVPSTTAPEIKLEWLRDIERQRASRFRDRALTGESALHKKTERNDKGQGARPTKTGTS